MNRDIKVSELSRQYEADFRPSREYLDSMPDLQNSPYSTTVPIERVGIHGFHMPLKVRQKDYSTQEVQATITGMVSLDADKAGINMSRIIRTAYKSMDEDFSIDRLCQVLSDYKRDLNTMEAHILLKFQYRLWQNALRSVKEDGTPEGGWQYYDITFDVNLNKHGQFRKVMYVDFVYSSACPCSTALTEHAAYTRGKYGIPHSQRSVAKVGVEFDKMIWIEDVVESMRKSLTTETLVFCKRQDEQDFALANGAQPKFVEDAARLIYKGLNTIPEVRDFKVIISHLESLHSHDAIAVITKGLPDSKFTAEVSFEEFEALKR